MAWVDYSGSLVGGDGQTREVSQLTGQSANQYTNTSSTGAEISIVGSTVILEFVLVSDNSIGAVGLKTMASHVMNPASSSDMSSYDWGRIRSSNTYNFFTNYNFSDKNYGNKIYVGSTANTSHSTIRKVFALHSKENDDHVYITRAHLFNNIVVKTSGTSTAYCGNSFSSADTWATYTDGAGVTYKSITVYTNSKFVQTTFSVIKGHKYTFNMHTRSEAGCDGIIISTSSLSSSASVTSAGIGRCSGVENETSCTYTATSSGTIYIYFKTDNSRLGNHYIDTSTHGYDYWDDYTTGDIEIIDELIKTVVTFNKMGGTSGTNSITIPYGTNLNTIAVITPTRTYCNFAGYYTGNSRNSPGTMYINSSGSGVNTTWNITSETYTLNALYNYGPDIVVDWYPLHCIYCSSSSTSASTLQTETSITLAGQIKQTYVQGTISYTQYDYDYDDHFGELLNMTSNKTIIIPAGTASGDYLFDMKYEAIPHDTTIFIKREYKECEIWIIPTYIVNETMELPDEIPVSLTQKKDIPAGNFTLNENNLSEYFEYPMTIPSTTQVIYNNGQTASSTPQIIWYIAQPITFASLGSTITSRQQVAIPDWSFINMSVSKRHYIGNYYDNRTRVIQIVSDILERDDVSYFSQFSDIGIDNLNYVNLIYDLEEEYAISINHNDLREIHSVDLLCKYLYVFHDVGGIISSLGVSNFIEAQYGDNSGDTVYREANTVTNLHISVSKNPIYVNDTATWNTTADFKSGDEGVSVNGLETFSGYDTSIININNPLS